ncbi:hypothetical protein C0991_002279, partial [Blastosporella zonata]
LCKRAAENIVELLGTWRSLYSLRYAPITLVQTAFSAGTIYLLGAVQAATGLRVAQESLKHALAQAQLCVQYLFEIGKSWQCATNIGEILRRLLQEQLKPLLDKRSIRADAVTGGAAQQQNQHQHQRPQQHSTGGASTSPSPPSSDALPRRRRSPSQRRTTPGREDGRARGRPSVPFQTSFPQSGSSSHRSPLSSSHRSPIPSTESDSQPQTPSSFSLQRSSNSISSMSFNQSQSWSMDYTPAGPVTDDGAPLFQSFSSGGGGSGRGAEMGIDIDLGRRGAFGTNASANTNMDVERTNPSVPGVTGQGIDPSSFLAMLGGEPLSDAPFLPTFDSYSPPPGESGPYSPRMQTAMEGLEAASQGRGIPEPDLLILAQFWDQNFS